MACRVQCLSLGYLGQLVARPEEVIHGGEPPKDSASDPAGDLHPLRAELFSIKGQAFAQPYRAKIH